MMTFERYINALRKGGKTITAFAALFLLMSVLYNMFLFQPTYVSKAKILIQDVEPTTFVTDIGNKPSLETSSTDKNPIMTQMEIIGSQDMAERVTQSLLAKKVLSLGKLKLENLNGRIRKAVTLKTPPATDIIEITVKWQDPHRAYEIAQTYIQEYYRYDVEKNNQSIIQTRKYIQSQLLRSEAELKSIREAIRSYRKSKLSVDLPTEVTSIVRQISDTGNTIADIQGRVDYQSRKVRELSSKLGILPGDVAKTMDAVAMGQNDNLTTLRQNLEKAEQEYASLKVRYPASTKKLTSLQESINAMKSQINEQATQTIGKTLKESGGTVIKDSVRTEILREVINSQSELNSLRAQKQSMEKILQQLRTHQSDIPEQQLTLNGLLERESNLTAIVGTLSSKLVEAKVRESGTISHVSVVQNPTRADSPSFPSRVHVMLIMTATGALLGCLLVLGQDYLRDKAQDAPDIEGLLNTPVFGALSWLPDDLYSGRVGSSLASSVVSLEYQRIATYLKILAEDKGTNILGFTSVQGGKKRAQIIVNIARILSSCNYSVLVIDADFRLGQVAKELGVDAGELPDLRELLTRDDYQRVGEQRVAVGDSSTVAIGEDPTDHYILKIADEKFLSVMAGKDGGSNPYEMVTSKNLPLLLERVKAKFDFVLVDTPPILGISDSIVISRYLDGLVLLCGVSSSRSELKSIRKLCEDNNVELVGAIARSQHRIAQPA